VTTHNEKGEVRWGPTATHAECLDVGQDAHLVVTLDTDDVIQQVELHSQRKEQVDCQYPGAWKTGRAGRVEGRRGALPRQNVPQDGTAIQTSCVNERARTHRVLLDVVARLGVGNTEQAGERSEGILHHRGVGEGGGC
jgi:hypothetical protein